MCIWQNKPKTCVHGLLQRKEIEKTNQNHLLFLLLPPCIHIHFFSPLPFVLLLLLLLLVVVVVVIPGSKPW